MNEETEMTPEQANSVDEQIRKIVKQNTSLLDTHAEDLKTVLAKLAALPSKMKPTGYLRLQGNHIIQIFNCGVAPLQKYFAESSAEFLEEVRKLFDICFSFCYTTDVSKRVSFESYVRALAFCFPSEPNQCLSTAVVSKLLELVQIIQEGKLVANVGLLQIYGANYLFGELLQIFESRRHEDYLVEIIHQTVRLASVDAERAIKDITLQSEHMICPAFVRTWMRLLTLTYVSNGFAFALAKVDSPSCTAAQSVLDELMPFMFGAVPSQTMNCLSWPITVCYFINVLEEMKRNGSDVSLPMTRKGWIYSSTI
ncbi:hypothetical protein OS493_037868 [Desmophyllum pertusum]|uniref:Uncharacterized protein n=1 Tax=Desmophyllum pertusum TaxID=174260 RepID=A0A9W9Z8I9_9CNID|nr:hypothetical protein OS493_037868 [Desmophyllum pertusum]